MYLLIGLSQQEGLRYLHHLYPLKKGFVHTLQGTEFMSDY